MDLQAKSVTPEFVAPRPPIGLIVAWYDHGGPGSRYFPAIVTETTDRNMISVLVIRPDGHMKTVRGTWHVSDPSLQTRDYSARVQRGCWDYLPGTLPVDQNRKSGWDLLAQDVMELRSAIRDLQTHLGMGDLREEPFEPDIESQIRELIGHQLSSAEIAERLGVTVQKVAAVVRRIRAEG